MRQKKKGITIDEKVLKNKIGDYIVFAAARENRGIEELKQIIDLGIRSKKELNKSTVKYSKDIEIDIEAAEDILRDEIIVDDKRLRWISLRMLERNEGIEKSIIDYYEIDKNIVNKVHEIGKVKDIDDRIIKSLVNKAEKIASESVEYTKGYDKFNRKLDKILVSKVTGIPIMILMLLTILWITITLANYPSQALSTLFAWIEVWIRKLFESLLVPSFISGILIDGVYTTVTWIVAVMLPPMAIFFPLFTLLEDSGYLPRIAFNLDKGFKRCCSCGKQALTMCMGLGCNAAGVVGCRIINSPRERLIAILTNNFMPCNGRFPTLITISSIFIGGGILGVNSGNLFSALAVTLVIILGVLITLIISRILSKTILKGVPSSFVLELPPYRRPQFLKVIVRSICDRTLYVLGRAVVVALPAGAIIWIFANISIGNGTLLSVCADFLNPFASAIGLDGYILMAFILGIPANEIVIPIIIMSYLKTSTMVEMNNIMELKTLLVANGWTTLTAINTMILCLLHYPCATTLLTIKKETNSLKWTVLAFLIPTITGIIVCFIIAQIWRLVV